MWFLYAAQAYSQIQQGKNANTLAGAQAGLLDYQAQVERQAAMQEATNIREDARSVQGSARTAYAASGVKVDTGTAAMVDEKIIRESEQDAFMAILEGNRRARGMNTAASTERIQGRQAQRAGYVNAAGTLLGGSWNYAKASGWRSKGAGFSGTQAPAPVESR
jgi:hypothetical protein